MLAAPEAAGSLQRHVALSETAAQGQTVQADSAPEPVAPASSGATLTAAGELASTSLDVTALQQQQSAADAQPSIGDF